MQEEVNNNLKQIIKIIQDTNYDVGIYYFD